MTHDVFISYSSKDAESGFKVCAALERHGVQCWMAPRNIVPGEGWAKSILGAIGQSRAMVLLLTENANHSQQVEREVERAVNKRVPIIPLRIEDIMPGEALEYFLSAPHWLDAFTPPLEQHLDRLAEAVENFLETKPEENSINKGQSTTALQKQNPPSKAAQSDFMKMTDLSEDAMRHEDQQALEEREPEPALAVGVAIDDRLDRAIEEPVARIESEELIVSSRMTLSRSRRLSIILIAALSSVGTAVTIIAATVWIGSVLPLR